MSQLRIVDITKRYGEAVAVLGVTLEVQSGEFFSILGPSGCGKTTLLRLIAGLESPTNGRVFLDSIDVTTVPPQKRDTVMVFQNYALFPHLNVFENVAFGLKARRIPRPEIQQRVVDALSSVQLEKRKEAALQELSGGEQQRVALARAIVVQPKVLLMDEPLSNLDVALRSETRAEIKRLQQATGITTVYVTHDQTEALGLSDRIAVMNEGRILQVGSPQELFERPHDVFVASFLGNANVLQARLRRTDSGTTEAVVNEDLRLTLEVPNSYLKDQKVLITLRPEHLQLADQGESADFKATVDVIEYQGTSVEYRLRVRDELLRLVAPPSSTMRPQRGELVGVKVDKRGCFVYPVRESYDATETNSQ
jgi:iron(III) transport system ATP-binding protein